MVLLLSFVSFLYAGNSLSAFTPALLLSWRQSEIFTKKDLSGMGRADGSIVGPTHAAGCNLFLANSFRLLANSGRCYGLGFLRFGLLGNQKPAMFMSSHETSRTGWVISTASASFRLIKLLPYSILPYLPWSTTINYRLCKR